MFEQTFLARGISSSARIDAQFSYNDPSSVSIYGNFVREATSSCFLSRRESKEEFFRHLNILFPFASHSFNKGRYTKSTSVVSLIFLPFSSQ